MDNETKAQPVLNAAQNFYAYSVVALGVLSTAYVIGVLIGDSIVAVEDYRAERRFRKAQSKL